MRCFHGYMSINNLFNFKNSTKNKEMLIYSYELISTVIFNRKFQNIS